MLYLKRRLSLPLLSAFVVAVLILATGVALATKGEGGGPPTEPPEKPATGESDTGVLFGDLYKILRYHGDENETVIELDEEGTKVVRDAVGGEPWLSDAGGWYVKEVSEGTYEAALWTDAAWQDAGYDVVPSRVVQPVASHERWGDIWEEHGVPAEPIDDGGSLGENRIPLVITYDETNDRFEGTPGLVVGEPTVYPDLTLNFDAWTCPFVFDDGTKCGTAKVDFALNSETGLWTCPDCGYEYDPDVGDPTQGFVAGTAFEDLPADDRIDRYFRDPTDPEDPSSGVLWADLIQEVDFGRVSVSRGPEAVMEAAFDEVVNSINSPDTIAIEIDAAGRLLLTKLVYDEYGNPVFDNGEQVEAKKAIDSPLENLALYTKLLTDGHLVTPADERAPIDRSLLGGIPISQAIELEDGPSTALRPTIDIDKMERWGLHDLVSPDAHWYAAYYDPEDGEVVYQALDSEYAEPTGEDFPEGQEYSTAFGITAATGNVAARDFPFAASFLAAAGDKTGDIGVDFVVYLNSILGINKVVGTSEDGTIDYGQTPVYFSFAYLSDDSEYDRISTLGARGEVEEPGGSGFPSTYTGEVRVLEKHPLTAGRWDETNVSLYDGPIGYENLDEDMDHFPNGEVATSNLLGFTQMADDDLSVIEFIHTYQIPELR